MPRRNKSKADVRKFIDAVSAKQGWGVNRSESFLDHLVKGLQSTYNRHGFFLCPCRDGSGDKQADKDITCPCVYNVPDQKEYGHCFCCLFFDKEHQEKDEDFKQIPDRRPDELYD